MLLTLHASRAKLSNMWIRESVAVHLKNLRWVDQLLECAIMRKQEDLLQAAPGSV